MRLFQPDPASGEAYAQTIPDGPIYKISPSAIKDLTRDLFTLQDKRLLGVDIGDIALLSIKTRDERYVLIHQHNEWVLEDQPTEKVRQDVADLVVSRIVNLPAEERVLKQAGPLAPYGLVAPVAEFVATGKDGRITGRLALGNQSGRPRLCHRPPYTWCIPGSARSADPDPLATGAPRARSAAHPLVRDRRGVSRRWRFMLLCPHYVLAQGGSFNDVLAVT